MAKTSIELNSDLFQRLFADPQRLREVIQVICQAAMAQEVEEHVGAQRHERTDERRGHRNGSKPRTLLTRVGELELSVPQVTSTNMLESLMKRLKKRTSVVG